MEAHAYVRKAPWQGAAPSDALLAFARSKVRRTLAAYGMRGEELEQEIEARITNAKKFSTTAIATELLTALPDWDFHYC